MKKNANNGVCGWNTSSLSLLLSTTITVNNNKEGKQGQKPMGVGGRTLQRRDKVGTKPQARDWERDSPHIARLRERRGQGEEQNELFRVRKVAFFVFIARVKVKAAFSCKRSKGNRSIFSVIEKKQVLYSRFVLLLFMSIVHQYLVMYWLNLYFCCHDFLSKQIYEMWNTIWFLMYVRISEINPKQH